MNIVNKKDNPKEFDILFKVLKNIDYEDISKIESIITNIIKTYDNGH